jgi:hypothetical protein
MANAQRVIRQEIESSRLLYGRAVLLYVRKALQSKIELVGNADLVQFGQKFVQELMEDFQYCDHMLCLPERNLQRVTPVGTGLVGPLILEVEDSLFSLSDFTTGIIDLNRSVFNPHNAEEIRRRYLFGIDQIVS